ncbi:Hypothetical protein D9617_21g097400 [Elsinoe fawcettii]|nr:Hypothetical protein D9617_21g097400 [Elsinoe fawcettii]
MSQTPSPSLVKLLQFFAAQRRMQLLNQQRQAMPADQPPPYTPIAAPLSSPSTGSILPQVEVDPSTSTITFNTGPRIQGSNNRYLFPATFAPSAPSTASAPSEIPSASASSPSTSPTIPHNPSASSTGIPDATTQAAIFLAAIQRLNCNVAERNASLAREAGEKGLTQPAPFLKVNVVINSGVTIVGNGNVVGFEGQVKKVERKGEGKGKRKRAREGETERDEGVREEVGGEKRVKREE